MLEYIREVIRKHNIRHLIRNKEPYNDTLEQLIKIVHIQIDKDIEFESKLITNIDKYLIKSIFCKLGVIEKNIKENMDYAEYKFYGIELLKLLDYYK
jgi:hypothetical protein